MQLLSSNLQDSGKNPFRWQWYNEHSWNVDNISHMHMFLFQIGPWLWILLEQLLSQPLILRLQVNNTIIVLVKTLVVLVKLRTCPQQSIPLVIRILQMFDYNTCLSIGSSRLSYYIQFGLRGSENKDVHERGLLKKEGERRTL